ncbi:MAG: hypothetical protein AVDCRST_MAG89-3560, partial [uncultured Gemmatimonadetes bacterium]
GHPYPSPGRTRPPRTRGADGRAGLSHGAGTASRTTGAHRRQSRLRHPRRGGGRQGGGDARAAAGMGVRARPPRRADPGAGRQRADARPGRGGAAGGGRGGVGGRARRRCGTPDDVAAPGRGPPLLRGAGLRADRVALRQADGL